RAGSPRRARARRRDRRELGGDDGGRRGRGRDAAAAAARERAGGGGRGRGRDRLRPDADGGGGSRGALRGRRRAAVRGSEELSARLLQRVPGSDPVGELLVRILVLVETHRLRADLAAVARDLRGALPAAQHPPDALEVRVVGIRARGVVIDVLRVPVLDRHHAQRGQPGGRPPAPPAEDLHQFSVTQTEPPLAAMPRGNPPPAIGGPAWSVFGSTRTTVPSPHATQTAPAPYATESAFRHAGMVARIPWRFGSTRITDPSTALIQSAPPPTAASV